MGRLYSWANAINASRKSAPNLQSPLNLFRHIVHYAFDLFFFRHKRNTSPMLNSWVARSLLSFYSYALSELYFFFEKPVSKRIRSAKKRRAAFNLTRGRISALRPTLQPVVSDDLNSTLLSVEVLNVADAHAEALLLVARVLLNKFCTPYAIVSTGALLNSNLSKLELFYTHLNELTSNLNLVGANLEWFNPLLASSYSRLLSNSCDIVCLIDIKAFDLESQSIVPVKELVVSRRLNKLSVRDVFDHYEFPRVNIPKKATPSLTEWALLDQLRDVDPVSLAEYPTCLVTFDFDKGGPALVTMVSGPVGAKSYTMRSRQFYRSGVFWCLGLSLLSVVGPYYMFYSVSFVFSFWWVLAMVLFIRGITILFWRFAPNRLKGLYYRFASELNLL